MMVPFSEHAGTSSYHLMPVLLPSEVNREKVMFLLREQGIQTSIHYPPVHRFSQYSTVHDASVASLPRTECVAQRQLTLPLHPLMARDDVEVVCTGLIESITKARVGGQGDAIR